MRPLNDKRNSLKVRIAFWAMLAMAIVVLSGTSLALWRVKDDMHRTAADSQTALIDSIATDLDIRINERHSALAASAAVLGSLDLHGMAALQDHFSTRPVLLSMFDVVFTTDTSGTIVFDSPMMAGRVGRNVADRDYYKQAMASGHVVVSAPVVGRTSNEPNIVFAVPMRNRAGEITGVMGGILYLGRANFLSALADVRIGKTGYVAVVTKGAQPTILMHAQRERVMTAAPPVSANPNLQRALQGFEGTVDATNSVGLEALFSFRSLKNVPWVVLTAYPTSEAYAQMHGTQRQIVLLAGLLMLLGGAAIWLLIDRQLAPLERLRQAMVDALGHPEPQPVRIGNETRELYEVAQAYNALMRHTQEVTSALKASKHQLRLITDNLPAQVSYVDTNQSYAFANASVAREVGTLPEALIGRQVSEVRARSWGTIRPHLERALRGHKVEFESEVSGHGRQTFYQATYIPDIDLHGQVRGVFAMTLDITHRKRAELRQAVSEARVRNILTHAPDAFASMTQQGVITEWNRQAELTFGWTRDEVIGRALHEVVIPQEYQEAHQADVARFRSTVAEQMPSSRSEVVGVRKDGQRIPVELSIALVKDGDLFVAHVFMRDITERKAAEQQVAASEKRVRDIADNLPALIAYFDREERCQFANDTALRIRGILRGELEGHTMRSAIGDDSYLQQEAQVREVLAGRPCTVEGQLVRNGRDLHFQSHFKPDLDDDGQVRGFYVMTFNITALKRAEAERAEGEKRLRTITDNLPVLISYIDAEERLQFANDTYRAWYGVDVIDAIGKPFSDVIGAAAYAQRREHLRAALRGERASFDLETTIHGQMRHLHTEYLPDVCEDGRVVGLYALGSDVTVLKRVEQQLSEQARIDSLTSLPNRRAFDERLRDAVGRSRRDDRPMALMFLDIDHFKQINDTYGHSVGDGVLREFARRLQHCVRQTDTVARLAGDEFVIILEGLKSSEEAALVARKIGETMRIPVMLDAQMLHVTSSVGVAFVDGVDVTPAEVVSKADAALYEAKRAGRNTYAMSRW
jgi:diguanylate cyclase (GGDEF)-like protein/PAS domain S-box-containing protein